METLAALLDRDPPGPGERDIDLGTVLHPFAWLDDEPIWDEMRDLALANGGRVWYDNAGKLHFETLGHLVRPQTNSWEDPTVSQYTFTTNRFQECNPRYDPEDVINHVIVEAVPLYVSTLQLVYSAGVGLADGRGAAPLAGAVGGHAGAGHRFRGADGGRD